jgi:hypothetical protein
MEASKDVSRLSSSGLTNLLGVCAVSGVFHEALFAAALSDGQLRSRHFSVDDQVLLHHVGVAIRLAEPQVRVTSCSDHPCRCWYSHVGAAWHAGCASTPSRHRAEVSRAVDRAVLAREARHGDRRSKLEAARAAVLLG